jgi:hypothetical protein
MINRVINQSDQQIPLCSAIMIYLPSAKAFYAVVVLLLLRNLSHISPFITSVRNSTVSQSLSSTCVSDPVFSFHSIWFDLDYLSRDGLQVEISSPWNYLVF